MKWIEETLATEPPVGCALAVLAPASAQAAPEKLRSFAAHQEHWTWEG